MDLVDDVYFVLGFRRHEHDFVTDSADVINTVVTGGVHFDDIEKNIYPSLRKFDGNRLRVQVTAYVWIDVYAAGLSKGVGVKALQESLGITPEETVVFGDYLNDIPMAEHAGASYAVSNAHPKLKEFFTDTIGSNDEESVTKKIIELLK